MRLLFRTSNSIRGFLTKSRLFALVWHHGSVFFKSSSYIPPILIWVLVFCMCHYPEPPLYAALAYMSAAAWLFYIMLWYSYAFMSSFEDTTEYILILQINSKHVFVLSKFIFLVLSCMALSLLGCLYPVALNFIIHITKGMLIFPEGISAADFFCGFVLHNMFGLLGISVVFLFQPDRLGQNNDFSLLLVFLFALMAITKQQVVALNGALKYVLWIFPPLSEIVSLFFDQKNFDTPNIAVAVLIAVLYSSAVVTLGQIIYNRKKYGPRRSSIRKHSDGASFGSGYE